MQVWPHRSRRGRGALRVAREAKRAKADEPRAEQGRRRDVVVRCGHREAIALVGDGELGEAAVEVVAREARCRTGYAPSGRTRTRRLSNRATARRPGPRRRSARRAPRSRRRRRRSRARARAAAWLGQLSINEVQIRPAHGASRDADEDLRPPARGVASSPDERPPRPFQHHRAHAERLEPPSADATGSRRAARECAPNRAPPCSSAGVRRLAPLLLLAAACRSSASPCERSVTGS